MKPCQGTGAVWAVPRFNMPTAKAVVLALALLATNCAAAQQAEKFSAQKPEHSTAQKAGNPMFQDYFTDGNDAGWVQVNRAWHVILGRYVQDGDYFSDALGRGGYSLTHEGDRSWRDYQLEATFDVTNQPGLPSPDVQTANFLFRVQKFKQPGYDVGLPTGATFYEVSVWAKGVLDPRTGGANVLPEGLVLFGKLVNGEQVVSVAREHSNCVRGTNSITIKVEGKRIEVWINGERVLTYTDQKPIRYGGIGLSTTWEAEAWFDNVVVSRVDGHR